MSELQARPMPSGAPAILKVLAHDLRWRLITALAHSDLRVQELVLLAGEPANLVSYHLRQLRDAGVVTEHRSAADGRDVYYTLDVARLHELYAAAGAALHPVLRAGPEALAAALASAVGPQVDRGGPAPTRVLFVCTHNSARSQMAEAILRALGGDRVEAFSAGSEPSTVHPDAVRALAEMRIDAGLQRSKHLDEFRGQTFDYVITLCDRVREACPMFSGDPDQIHWSLPDPAAVEDVGGARYRAFVQTGLRLSTRVRYLLPVIAHEQHPAA